MGVKSVGVKRARPLGNRHTFFRQNSRIGVTMERPRNTLDSLPEPSADNLPVKPESLSPVASEFWDLVTRTMRERLRPSDGPALEILANTHALWVELDNQWWTAIPIDRLRITSQLSAVASNFIRLAKEFHLTPASRAKMKPLPSEGPPRVRTRPLTKLDLAGPPDAH